MNASPSPLKLRAVAALRGLSRRVPAAHWLRGYKREWLPVDLVAGLTVWGLMVPSAMGYASVAGVPTQMGLYAAMAGTLLYAIFGSSRHVKVATSSTPAVMSATIVGTLAAGDATQVVPLSIALAVTVGLIFLVAGFVRLGFVADFLSKSVISGFIFGLAVVVVVGQAPKLLGIPAGSGNVFQQIFAMLTELDQFNPYALALGAGALAMILFIKARAPKIPAALVALVAGILAVALLNLDQKGVVIVGAVPTGLPAISLPGVTIADVIAIAPAAAAMCVVLFGETIGAGRTFATKHRYEIDPDQELIALGVSNLGSSLIQGIAIDASLSNSAAADTAGAKTQVASLVTSGLILLTVVALTPLFYYLPQTVLGAIVISSVLGLLNVSELKRIFSLRRSDFWLAMTSMFGIIAVGVLSGLVVAVLLSLVLVVYRASRPNGAVLGKAPGRLVYGDMARNPDYVPVPGLLIYRLDAALFFANANLARTQLRALAANQAPRGILIDLAATYNLDVASVDMLDELLTDAREADIELMLAHVKSPVRALLAKSGLLERIGPDRIYADVHEGAQDFVRRQQEKNALAPSAQTSPPEAPSDPQGISLEP